MTEGRMLAPWSAAALLVLPALLITLPWREEPPWIALAMFGVIALNVAIWAIHWRRSDSNETA